MRSSIDVQKELAPENLGTLISNLFDKFQLARSGWLAEIEEIRNFVYATDTRTTSNAKLPWSNSTVLPKLTQIYDNLKANYTATLFPQEKWLSWKGGDVDSASTEKARVIEAYMQTKLSSSAFITEVDKCLDDYLLTGNCFAMSRYERDTYRDANDIEQVSFAGPRAYRVDPTDIVFDITATSFNDAPKIVRTLHSLGKFRRDMLLREDVDASVVDRVIKNRGRILSGNRHTNYKGLVADGFGSVRDYYSSGVVEVLTFYGDIFDSVTGEIFENYVIEIVDRCYVLAKTPLPSWTGYAPVYHAAWRTRPGNLMGMSPLANLVGMQYRVNHLENLRADVFDQIALPMLLIQGEVQDFDNQPGSKVFLGENGRVTYLNVDSTALTADNNIANYLNLMEEMAGAPRQAMGIRTPGEKTAFEVQTLQQYASRVFQHKAAQFEISFLEPLINGMLEVSRREIDEVDLISFFDESLGSEVFRSITRKDLQGRGKIRPIGARHFAERALRVQNISQLVNLKMSDQSIGAHLSGKEIARILADELREPKLFAEGIGIREAREVQEGVYDQQVQLQDNLTTRMEVGI